MMATGVRKRTMPGFVKTERGPQIEDMLQYESIESLKDLKVQGVSQFSKEYEQTRNLGSDQQVCHMQKLFENTETGEKIDPIRLSVHEEQIFDENCSPRFLF